MRKLLLWTTAGLLAVPLLLLAAAGLALDDAPTLPQTAAVAPGDIERALQLLQRNDPRGKLPGITRAVVLGERDLALLIIQATRRFGPARAQVALQDRTARVQASLPLPGKLLGAWLNLDLRLSQSTELPTVQQLHLGRLPVPGWLAEQLLPQALAAMNLRAQGALAQRLVSHVGFQPRSLVLAYAWPADLQQDLAGSLVPAAEQARLAVYSDRLAALGTELASTGPVSLARLLPPLFTLARQRSRDSASAALENRAALIALAFVVNGQNASALRNSFRGDFRPQTPAHPASQPLNITLLGRRDTPQHFLVSAALSAEGGGPLSDAIGLYKEVADSRGGSGFSFNDLAADRAGTRLGQQAMRHPLAVQALLAAGVQEHELMPTVADLPESLTSQEFQRRFGGIGGLAYQQMMIDIESRLDRLALLAPGKPLR